MTNEKKLEILKKIEVMREGHFLLTSGRHSDKYMQCARLFQYPEYSQMFCAELCEAFKNTKIDLVAGPAIGGIIMAYEVARQLEVKNVFAEREEGKMTFRRGFEIEKGQNVLVVGFRCTLCSPWRLFPMKRRIARFVKRGCRLLNQVVAR